MPEPGPPSPLPVPDHELLARYIRGRDQQAFAELVRRHVNLVHGAARRQAPHAADDVTQAVFLLLAQKAARLPRNRPLAGWLCQTTRFCCAAVNRTEARRRHHEQEAAAMAQASNPGFAPDKTLENLLPLLDESLATLSGSERDAVVLRYLEGRSLADTGAELSINADAAARRTARGLEKLRAFFAKRGYVVPAAAMAGLLTAESAKAAPTTLAAKVIGLGAHGVVVSAKTAAIAKGASAMMTWIKVKLAAAVIAAAVIAGGTGVVVIQQTLAAAALTPVGVPAPPIVAPPPKPVPPSPTPVAITPPPSPLPVASPATAPATMPGPIAPVIHGTAVDYRGQSVADGTVVIIRETNLRRPEWQVVGQLRTAADGRFTAQLPDSTSEYRVVVRTAGLAVGWDRIQRRQGLLVSDLDIVLDEPGEVGGVVVDEAGQPVGGAQVRTWVWGNGSSTALLSDPIVPWLEARTDADGRFSIGQLPVNATVELWVTAPGKIPYHSRREGSDMILDHGFVPGQTDLRIALKPAGQVAGRVVDQDTGKPVPGVDILVIGESDWDRPRVTTAPDGTFFLDGLTGDTHRIQLEQVGYASDDHGFVSAPVAVDVQTGRTTADVVIPAQRGGVVEMVFQGKPDGQPVLDIFAGIRAEVVDNTFDPWVHTIYGSGKGGITHFRLLPGPYALDEVRTFADRWHTWERESCQFTVEPGTTRKVVVPLRTLPRLAGQAVDADGRGVAKAIVEISGNLAYDRDTQTDAQGGFTLVNGGSDDMAESFVLVRQPERNLVGVMDVTPHSPPLEVPLQTGNILAGRVIDENSRGVPGVALSLNMYFDKFFMSLHAPATTDAQGRYRVSALPAGRKFGLKMNKVGFTTGSARHTFADDEQGKTIDLPDVIVRARNQEISGLVVDEKGGAVINALVYVDADGRVTRTDQQGRFILRGLGSGQATLEVRMYAKDPQGIEVSVNAGAKGVRIVYHGAGIAPPTDHKAEPRP